MKVLICDIQLGGSTSQFLTYHKRNSTKEEFILCLLKAIKYRAKTRPAKQARRAASLIGLCMDKFPNDEEMLDIIVESIQRL